MTEMLVFNEASQKQKVSHLTKSIKYLSPIQSIVYALRHWGYVSQNEIADSLGYGRTNITKAENQARAILTEERFPRNKNSAGKELIMPSNISDGKLAPLKKLTSLQAFIGALRLGLCEKEREIAKILGCSRPRVNKLTRESRTILGRCELVEIWNRIGIGGHHPPRSPEQRRTAKESWTLTRRQEQSEKMKQFYQTPKGEAQKKKQSEDAKERQKKWSEEPRHINKREQQFQDFLTRWGFSYKYVGDGVLWIGVCIKGKCNHFPYVRTGRNPDFIHKFLPGVIEVYGDYFHKEEKPEDGGDNGRSRIDHYATFGYNTLIVWEHEVKDALKDSEMALSLYNKLYEFESSLREKFQSEFGIDFPMQFPKLSNPA